MSFVIKDEFPFLAFKKKSKYTVTSQILIGSR